MFCGKCGTENENGAKFCKGCGAELAENKNSAQMMPKSSNAGSAAGASVDLSKVTEKVNSIPKQKLIAIGGGAIVALFMIIMIATAKPTINLNKYLVIETEGYDGYGKASVSIDWDAIEEKYGDKLKYGNKAKEELGNYLKLTTPVEVLGEMVDIELSQKDKLSNGTEIEYKWDIEENISDYVGCKVKFKDSTYSVEGLTEVGKFDPFDSLTVSFTGIAPNGSVEMEYTGSELNSYDFSCDKAYGLKNDDKIVVTISDRDMTYYAEKFGKIPSTTEKEYVVSGLQEYVDSYDALTEEFLAEVKKETEDSIYAYTASSYSSSSSLSNLAYAGYILNSVKEAGRSSNYNNLYMIYKGTVSNSDGKFSTATVYFPVRFKNILKCDEGLSYESNEGIVGSSYFDDSWNSTRGYINPLTCYIDIVEANRDSYTAESGDGFEAYASYELIEKLSDISDTYKNQLHADVKDLIESYVAQDYNDGEISNLAVAGEYLLLAKNQGTDFGKNNKLYVVYSATISSRGGNYDTTTIYYPVEFDGIVKLPGDEFMFTACEGIIGRTNLGSFWYSSKGYIDGSQMYNDIITASRNNYTYEVSEGLKKLGD